MAVKILKTTVGIRSNTEELLPTLPLGVRLESLLTDFCQVEQIPWDEDLDGHIFIENATGPPTYEWDNDRVIFKGPFAQLQKNASDPRYSLWGNQGFLYRYALFLLEKKHKIYNLHACALYREEKDILYIVIGAAGSGKTVYLLSGLTKGLKLFSTETVHFRLLEEKDIVWYKGSLVDNVRRGTLVYDFPRFLPSDRARDPRTQWQEKTAIDLAAFSVHEESLKNPCKVHILFPRIERGFDSPVRTLIEDKRKAEKLIFDNITQKLAETTLLYDELAVLGLDRKDLTGPRMQAVKGLIDHPTVVGLVSVTAGPQNCWNDILE